MNKPKKNKKKINKTIILRSVGWFFSVLFIFAGISALADKDIIYGIGTIIVGILVCPYIFDRFHDKFGKSGKIVQIIGIFLAVVIAGNAAPKTEDNNSISNDSKESIKVEYNNDKSVAVDNTKPSDESKESTSTKEKTAALEGNTDKADKPKDEATNSKNDSYEDDTSNPTKTDNTGTLEVHFIDVGQGDATLIKCNGHNLLIDAGNNNKGTTVQLYLNKQGVTSLDAVIWTHPNADHIGGADVITTKYDIGITYMPNISSDTKTYLELMDAIDYRNYKITNPSSGDSFDLGGATVTFLGPNMSYGDDNNNSLVVLISYGETKVLITGDAEYRAESDLVRKYSILTADIYKSGHHGSSTATSDTLLNRIKPKYAVISCGKDNAYGHPHKEVLDRLKANGIEVFRTDEQGSIVAISDGKNITWNTEPSISWKPGTVNNTNSDNSDNTSKKSDKNKYGKAPDGAIYIGNTNNMKLHKASCNGLPQSQNQMLFSTLEEATAAGYNADNQCQICKPYGEVPKPTNPPKVEEPSVPPTGASYIGNANNHKLHRNNCSGLPYPENQVPFASKEEAFEAGYNDPCKRCNP